MPLPLTPSRAAAALALAFLAAVPAKAETVLVSNEKDNTITVLDGATLRVVRTVPVGERPRGIALSRDNRQLYVCAGDSDRVDVLDLQTWRVVRHLPSGSDPELAALHPDGRRLFVANEDDNMVTVVDVERGVVLSEIPVGVEPEGMGISPDGRYVVNTSETTPTGISVSTTPRSTSTTVTMLSSSLATNRRRPSGCSAANSGSEPAGRWRTTFQVSRSSTSTRSLSPTQM